MNKLTRTTIQLFIISLFIGLINYLLRIVFARNLTLEEYGLFYAVFALVSFFAPFRDLGLGESTLFFINKYVVKSDKKRIKASIVIGILPQLILGIVIAAILFLLKGYLVKNYFKNPLADPIMTILIILFAFETIRPTLIYLFLAYQKVALSKLNDLICSLSILIVSIILFSFSSSSKTTVPAIAYLIGSVVAIVIFGIIFYTQFKDVIKEKAAINKALIKEMFNYAIPIMFSTAGAMILVYSDTLLLTYFKGVELVGLYNIAYPALGVILIFITPISIILFPKISNLYHQKKSQDIKNILSIIYNNFLLLTIPLGLAFFVYSDLIISLLFGVKYIGATNTLKVFSLAFIFIGIRDINFNIIAGIGKVKERSKILYYGAGFNVILDLILIPKYGASGAAIATGLGFALMVYLTTKLILKEYPIHIEKFIQLKTVFSGLLFLASLSLLKKIIVMSNAIIEAIIVCTISGIIYVLALYLLKVVTKEKILFLKELVLKE